ncbi:MAG TPA: EamA family transporter [Acidobacteriaceae bacterium]|jgi:drug/metabolite transporter (DMT)-like permease
MFSPLRGNALFALSAAVLWGGGDFSGGMGVKSAGGGLQAALRVVLLSHITSFTVLVGIALLRHDVFPHGVLLAWGIAAGVAGGLALTCFYIALSRGAMGASAALSGLLAAALPAALTLWQDGSPGLRAMLGFAVAGAAIWLIAAGPAQSADDLQSTQGAQRSTVVLALLAGVGFGLYFIALKMAGPAGVIWPMATARMGSLSVCSLLLLGVRLRSAKEARVKLRRRTVMWAFSTALLDTSGNLLFLAATRAGRLDVAAVLASLYPASTILLAALALGESPTRRQAIGMTAAVVAVVLIAL